MLFSENKLREMASLGKNIATKEIVDAINSIGFEVESCEKLSDVQGIKFGHVLNTYKNTNSNNLNVCEIEFDDKNRIIQTTANNVKVGDYLMAFVPGSSINGVTFGEKEMKGIVSEGMLVALDELGFNQKLMRKEWNDGIFLLDKISLKKCPIKELGLDDNIIDVSILTNRSDANSYVVMSLELSAYFQTKPYKISKTISKTKSNIKMNSIENNYISGIEANVDDFKLDLKDLILLLKSRIKSENDIQDISSLTLIMTGVSSRVYDAKKIIGDINLKIEKNIVFENLKIKEALVIKDQKNILSIAGVLESSTSKYKSDSHVALFEFASFDPKEIRNSTRIMKMTNNSSINSSKAVSYGSIEFAINFLATKFPCSNHINEFKNPEKIIPYSIEKLNQYAGFNIESSPKYAKCLQSLEILGFIIKDKQILIPSYRHDIEVMQDVVEEVFRFYGLNNFNDSQPFTKFNNNAVLEKTRDFSHITSVIGYTQFWTYTLVNKEKNDFNPFSFDNKINLLTYTSEEHNSIRNSIAPSLEENYNYNAKRRMNGINFFDTGMINDKKALCIASDNKTYAQMKNDIFKIYGKELIIKPLDLNFIHPKYNAGLFDDSVQVGWIGKMHPKNTKNNIIFAEILTEKSIKQIYEFSEYDNSPLKERDITVPLKKNESINQTIIEFKKINGIFEIKKIDSFIKEDINYVTFKIKMNDASLLEFDKKFNI